MDHPKQPKKRQRYSIGEWYGTGFEKLSPTQRRELGAREIEVDELTGTPCPFQMGALCNKKGGVCSLRSFEQSARNPVTGVGPLITTCPNRFLESDLIFNWVAEVILETSEPLILNQIGFLDRLRPETPDESEENDKQDFIGRIDNVLVHPTRTPLDWCALELQAVYFSGKSMRQEFKMLSGCDSTFLPFPAANRRPDWRSSGPKRLLPQLQTKVPTIRTWGKKMAVVIDEAFFHSLIGLQREKYLSNSEIAWFVVGYDPAPTGWKITQREVVFTRLESSIKALTGGTPLPREKFEEQLRRKLGLLQPGHPFAIQ